MTNELKDRISKIRSGEVPEGYKKTKVGILPNDWNIVKLKDIAQHITKKNSEMKYTETLTNSAALGIINQTDYFEKQISNNNNIDGYYVVEEGDYSYNPRISVSAPCGPISKSHISETGIMSPLYTVFRFSDIDDSYYESYFKSSFWHRYMNSVANYGARFDRMNITNDDFFSMPLPSPPLPEQQKIAEILSTQDKVIDLIQNQIEELKKLKKAYLQKMFPQKGSLFPEIRFKEFTDAWEQREFDKVFLSFPNKNYQLQSTEYYESGKFPIIDQGKKAIIGYSDNESKVCNKYPSIIFGDHTTELKYVDFPFIIGADGVKTLSVKDGDTLFQYYNLQVNNVQPTGYNRHFSMLKEISLCVPCLAEQQQIGTYFRSLDTLITLHQRKLKQEQQKKKALMQLLLTGIVRVKV